jgi:hypothetical protein
VASKPPITVDEKTLYPFTIVLAQTGQQIHLAAETKADTETWVNTIQDAAAMKWDTLLPNADQESSANKDNIDTSHRAISSTTLLSTTPSKSTIDSIVETATTTTTETVPAGYMTNVRNPVETRAFVPPEIMEKIENVAKVVLEELEDDASGWEVFYEKTNYSVKRKIGTSVMEVKVTSELPYSLLEVVSLMINGKRGKELDDGKTVHDVVKVFSNHTWIEYWRYFPVSIVSLTSSPTIVE